MIQVPDIPYTLNGKRVEVLVKKVSSGLIDWLYARGGLIFDLLLDYQWSAFIEC